MGHIQSPIVFVLFGATGDLVKKKIIPALFHLYRQGKLPAQCSILGYARKPWTNESFQEHARTVLTNELDKVIVEEFAQLFEYQQGALDEAASYESLQQRLAEIGVDWDKPANHLFYLAVPPELYAGIFDQLSGSKLVLPQGKGSTTGWTRIIIEKPFGDNAQTAQALDAQLESLFDESQLYRIDHYLAKETLQNILTFRFDNTLFEDQWNNQRIERIDIRLLETLGVESRGAFYDGIGTLRDVGQNHLLAMLATTIMDLPKDLSADAVRLERARCLLVALMPLATNEIRQHTFRAQYDGYRSIVGVRPDSTTETYYYAETKLQGERWGGVTVSFEAGKRMARVEKDIIVTFKQSPNRIIFRLEPNEGIEVDFLSKKPGLSIETELQQLHNTFSGDHVRSQYVAEYAKLLLDCMEGDQRRFVSTDELQAMWRFVDPIIIGWQQDLVPLASYPPDSCVRPQVKKW